MPEIATSYATVADLEVRAGTATLVQLTDDLNTGVVNEAKATVAIDDAAAEIDSYLSVRYQMPIVSSLNAAVPKALVRCCCDIAYYRLQEMRPLGDIEDSRKRYKDCIAWLIKLSEGKATLGDGVLLLGSGSNSSGGATGSTLTDGSTTIGNGQVAVNAMPKVFTAGVFARHSGQMTGFGNG